MRQGRLISCNECTTLVGDIDDSRCSTHDDKEYMGNHHDFSQFCYKTKTSLKKKVFFKKFRFLEKKQREINGMLHLG